MPLSFIHRFLPGRSDGAILLLLHGTGGNEEDLLDLGHSLDPSATLLSPRGKALENGNARFFRRLAEGVFDQEDLIARTHELAEFVRAARDQYKLGERPICAVGYSNGANIAASVLLLRPEVLSGAILLRAMVPFIPDGLPDLSRVRVFLAGGKNDRMIPPASTESLAGLLRRSGAEVSMRWSEGGHELQPGEIQQAREWLTTHFSDRSFV